MVEGPITQKKEDKHKETAMTVKKEKPFKSGKIQGKTMLKDHMLPAWRTLYCSCKLSRPGFPVVYMENVAA